MSEPIKRILYAEDEEDIQVIGKMALEEIGGYEVLLVSNGKEVLEKGKGFQPDVILLDVMMPEMDGLETFQKLKNTDWGKNIPVIFLTAKAQQHEVQSYLDLGAVGIIIKPFDPLELSQQVEEIWKKKHSS